MGEIYVPHVFVFNTSTVLSGTYNQATERNFTVEQPDADGSIYAHTSAITALSDAISGGCYDIESALALMGVGGAAVTSCVVFDAQVARTGGKSGSSVHVKRSIANGLLVPRSLSLMQKSSATLSFSLGAYNTSAGAGIVTAASQALTNATAGGAGTLFGLGPLSINGSVVDDVMQVDVDFGLQVDDLESEGDVGVKLRTILGARPMVRFRTSNAAYAATVGDGLEVTEAIVVCRKRSADGSFYVAAAEAEHVTLSGDAGIVVPTVHQGRRIEGSYDYRPHYGAAAPLVLATGTDY